MKAPDAPALSDLESWRTFLGANGREETSPEAVRRQIAEKKLAILHQAEHKARRENRIKDGEIIEFATVQKFIAEMVHNFFFGELDRLKRTMPALLKGRSELEIHIEFEAETEKIKAGLKSRLEALAQ